MLMPNLEFPFCHEENTAIGVQTQISQGKPSKLLREILFRDHSLILSDPILEELSKVASDEKIATYVNSDDYATFLETLLENASFVRIKSRLHVFNDADDLVLGTAKDGKVDFIVTGDKHMLELKRFRGIKMITVGHALKILRK